MFLWAVILTGTEVPEIMVKDHTIVIIRQKLQDRATQAEVPDTGRAVGMALEDRTGGTDLPGIRDGVRETEVEQVEGGVLILARVCL